VIVAAYYLDIPGLVEQCASTLAVHLHEQDQEALHSSLPPDLLALIFSKLTPAALCDAEQHCTLWTPYAEASWRERALDLGRPTGGVFEW